MPEISKGRSPPRAEAGETVAARELRNRAINASIEHESGPVADSFNTVFDLVEARANESGIRDEPLIFYPSDGTKYDGYTAAEFYRLSNKAAAYYHNIVPQRASSDDTPTVVGLLGPSSFDYLVSVLALSRLGHTVLFLSTRISEEAHVNLLGVSKATCLFVDVAFETLGRKVAAQLPHLSIQCIAFRDDVERCDLQLPTSPLDPSRERHNVAWIVHSSGSTSLPKPNYQSHAAALQNFKSQFNLVGFVVLPLYHMQGLGCVFRSIMNRKPIYMYNASLPLTSKHLHTTLAEHSDIQILYGVPYAMKLLADSDEGIALCRRLDVLFCGGGACPKPVGDSLTRGGVYLVSHLGSTETGQLMNSYRPRSEIEEWDWLRPSELLQKYLRWEAYDDQNKIFEMVVLDGWPSKVATNRDDGAYATKDLWERHPDSQKNAWRWYARKDDTIVLSNGEKANPILFEDVARKSPMVDDAIVFGSEKPYLGMLVSTSTDAVTREHVIEEIWPAVQRVNEVAPAHAQLSKDMIRLLRPEEASRIRRTDKSTVIRPAFYKDFAALIESTYDEPIGVGRLVLDRTGLVSFLNTEVKALMQSERQESVGDSVDLFSLGMDSLQATRLRSAILKTIDIGTSDLAQNFVFDYPSIDAMAAELVRMRTNGQSQARNPAAGKMETLIRKYGADFPKHQASAASLGEHVVVTGATGSLGAHIVAQLADKEEVLGIHCLVRAGSNAEALCRVRQSLQDRKLEVNERRLQALAVSFTAARFGLSDIEYANLAGKVTCVIHGAWNVNFNLSLESFESDCIQGTRHLIDLCLESGGKRPAPIIFCSSISAVAETPSPEIQEEICESLQFAQHTGYGQSKLVGEMICLEASREAGLMSRVLRIGQIIGDTKAGIWNRQEAVPMMIQSAETIGALPVLDEECSWLPVDVVAAAVVESWCHGRDIPGQQSLFDVFNIVNPITFHWTRDLLPMLEAATVEFDAVSSDEWLRRLRAHPDPLENRAYKLIDFFTEKYGGEFAKTPAKFRSEKARAASESLDSCPKLDQELVDKLVKYVLGR